MNMKPRKVVLKGKKTGGSGRFALEKVIGISAKGNNSVGVNPATGNIAYTAAGLIVFYNPQTNKQINYIFNQNSRIFSCLAFSPSGKYLATGEGTCKQPEIVIWELSESGSWSALSTLKGHKYGVDHLLFSPDGKSLVSIGGEHDKGLFVWDWRHEKRLTSNKVMKRIQTAAFSDNGEFLVTAGVSSIKVWEFQRGLPIVVQANTEIKYMSSRNLDLAEMKDRTFVGIVTRGLSVYALTTDGILCFFTPDKVMDKWMDINSQGGHSLHLSGNLIACGCKDGLIRCFEADSLQHVTTLPRPPPLGQANITPNKRRQPISADTSSMFADVVGLLLYNDNKNLWALYSDRTVFIWDISNLSSISVTRAFLFHSGSINDISISPQSSPELSLFATASSDKTVRIWHIPHGDARQVEPQMIRNVYSKDLSRIVYTSSKFAHFKADNPRPEEDGSVKCVKFSPDGELLACGDMTGVLRVYKYEDLGEIFAMQAHESDINCIDYSGKQPFECRGDGNGPALLATGSRDRLIHVFDLNKEFRPVMTIDDHSSSISDLCFTRPHGEDKLISCGADKALIFRTLADNTYQRYQQLQRNKKLHSVAPHPVYNTVCVGEDKELKIWGVDTGKITKAVDQYDRPSKSATDSNFKVAFDATGLLMAVCNTDRNLRVIDYYNVKTVCRLNVGDLTTCAAFTANGRKLISATADGCVFVWKLPSELILALRARMQNIMQSPVQEQESQDVSHDVSQDDIIKQELISIQQDIQQDIPKTRDSMLPAWARTQKTEEPVILSEVNRAKLIEEGKDSEEEEEKQEPVAVVKSEDRSQFTVTKSQILKQEETARDEQYDDNDEEEEDKLPELEIEDSIKKPGVRDSLSSSFWKKKEEKKETPLFFEFEPIETEAWHVPKIGLQNKKDIKGAQNEINDAKKRLQEIGLLKKTQKNQEETPEIIAEFSPKTKKKLRKDQLTDLKPSRSPNREDVLEIIDESDLPAKKAEGNNSITGEKSIKKEKKREITQVEDKNRLEAAHRESNGENTSKKNLPEKTSNKNEVDEEIEFLKPKYDSKFKDVQSSYVIEEDIIRESVNVSISKSQQNVYTEGFKHLRDSLLDAKNLLANSDINDPEYSMSLEESQKEIGEIHTLLVEVSNALGLTDPKQAQETAMIQHYSEKLLSVISDHLKNK